VALAEPPLAEGRAQHLEALRAEASGMAAELARRLEPSDELLSALRNLAVQADGLVPLLQSADPYLTLALERGAVGLLAAVTTPADVAKAERHARMSIALEQLRQAARDLAEGDAVGDDVPIKQVCRFLAEQLELPQAQIAALVGTSDRTWDRWTSEDERPVPVGEEARRIRVLARLVRHLRHSLTGPGVATWLRRGRPELAGASALDLLADPEEFPRIETLAARTRTSLAA